MHLPTSNGFLLALHQLFAILLSTGLLIHEASAQVPESNATAGDASLKPRDLPEKERCWPSCKARPLLKMECNGDVPGVDECVARFAAYMAMRPEEPNLFWSGSEVTFEDAEEWARRHFRGGRFMDARQVLKYREVSQWYKAESFWIAASMDPRASVEHGKHFRKMLDGHASQAYAEVVAGDAYLAIKDGDVPDDRSWSLNHVWGAYEWPALTRNPLVERIFRVDPFVLDAKPRLIWTQAQGPQGVKPRGSRGPISTGKRLSIAPDPNEPQRWKDVHGRPFPYSREMRIEVGFKFKMTLVEAGVLDWRTLDADIRAFTRGPS